MMKFKLGGCYEATGIERAVKVLKFLGNDERGSLIEYPVGSGQTTTLEELFPGEFLTIPVEVRC